MARQAADELIADFLLRYYRQPMRYRAQAQQATHLFGNLDIVLRLALGRRVEFATPALRSPGVTAELQRAAVFCIQQQFFRDDATHYEVLGLAGHASAAAVRENFRLLMQLIHPDRLGASGTWSGACAARANHAHAVLKGPRTRVEYDREQAALRAASAARSAATGFARPARPRVQTRVTLRRRKRLYAPVLPEWMTAHVGSFFWRHPAFTAFAGLIGTSALIIGASVWLERDGASAGESSYAPLRASTPGTPERAALVPRGVAVPEVLPDMATNAVAAGPVSADRTAVAALLPPPGATEVEALLVDFISAYEHGRIEPFARLFDDDAQANLYRGRAAIRREYDQLFQATAWRRMDVSQLRLQFDGDRTQATGDLDVKIGWRDGRSIEQRIAMDMELVHRGDRTVIAKLTHRPR